MTKFLFLLLTCFISLKVMAVSWMVNKDHSEILFQVPYLSVSELTGRFNDSSGSAQLDQGKVITGVEINILTASIDTGNKMRDNHLKGSDFFQAQAHPFITFKSSKVIKLKPSDYRAEGSLTMKGITKPFIIEFSVTDSIKDTWGYENKFVKFKSKINRKDFHIKWNKTLDNEKYLVGDEITFWGVFQIQPFSEKTPNSKHMIPDTEYIRKRESGLREKLRKLINGEKSHE